MFVALVTTLVPAWSQAAQLPLLRSCSPRLAASGVCGATRLAVPSMSFLADAAAAPGAKTLPSGLVYEELTAGDGESPTPEQKVTVRHVSAQAPPHPHRAA